MSASGPVRLALAFTGTRLLDRVGFSLFISEGGTVNTFRVRTLISKACRAICRNAGVKSVGSGIKSMSKGDRKCRTCCLTRFPRVGASSMGIVLGTKFLNRPSLCRIAPLYTNIPTSGTNSTTRLRDVVKLTRRTSHASSCCMGTPRRLGSTFRRDVSSKGRVLGTSRSLVSSEARFLSGECSHLNFKRASGSTLRALVTQTRRTLGNRCAGRSLCRLGGILTRTGRILTSRDTGRPAISRAIRGLRGTLSGLRRKKFRRVRIPSKRLRNSSG